MIRLLGALLLIAGGGLMGLSASEPLRRRSRLLGEFASGLRLLEQELELGGLPMPLLMKKLSQQAPGSAGELFSVCGEKLEERDRPELCLLWSELAEGYPDLGREAVELLRSLGAVLGRCSAEEQLRAVDAARRGLEELKRQTDLSRPARDRLCRALGLSGGALAAIFLL